MPISKLDARQSLYRGILQELFPYASNPTLDILLESINADLTPPLKVDATSTPSLVVDVGPAIVPNPESNRNKSISFIGTVIPTFTSGTVTFPSTNGGTITASPGSTSILNLPSGDYAQALLSLDTSGNMAVSVGTPNAVQADALVPPPIASTLPFAYVTLFNNSGTIQNITQSNIFQLASGGSGSGGGGIAQEVPITIATTSIVVTFPTAQSSISYSVLAQMVNTTDVEPEFQPITITNKLTTGFTATWNSSIPTNNYLLDYIVSPGITQEQAGEMPLSLGLTTVTVNIPIPLTSISYVVIAEMINTIDSSIQFQPVTVTAKTNSNFTVSWNAGTNTANYRLGWQLAGYQ